MPIRLTPDEIQAQFSTGSRAEAPEAGLGTRFGAAIDRAQAGLYGIGEAVGLPLADARMANQAAQEQSMQRYFADNPNDPQSYKDIDSMASALRYVRGLGIDASPELITSLLTGGAGAVAGLGTAGRVGLAAAANYPAALGDILQNQREEAGRTNFGVAAGLAVPYAAADLVGLDAALAGGRMARTGIRTLDELQGVRGGLARTGANVALNAPVEGASETFQELINQAGRVAVGPRAEMFSPEAMERYGESFVGGAALGGAASGVLGGWRRSEGYSGGETDLTAAKPTTGLSAEFVGPPAFVGPVAPRAPAEFVGPAPELVGPSVPQDLTTPAAAGKSADRQANVDFRKTYGLVPTPYNKEIVQAIEAEGFTWDSPEVVELRNYVEQQPLNKKRKEKALEQLDTLVLGLRQQAPAPAAQPTPTVANVAQAPQAIQTAPQGQAVLPAATQVTPAAPVVAPVVRPQPPAPLVDTSDDALEIARATGNAAEIEAMREEAAGLRRDAEDINDEQLSQIIGKRFAKSKNAERDASILRAYLTALRNAPKGGAAAIQEAIGAQFGIKPVTVRKIGNPSAMVSAGKELGFSAEQVLSVLNVDDNTKAQFTEIGQLTSELDGLRKQYAAKGANKDQIAARMSALSERITKAKEASAQERQAAFSKGLSEAGITAAEGETAGFGMDTDRSWAEVEASGSATTKIMELSNAQDSLRQALEEFQQIGNAAAIAEVEKRISALDAELSTVVAAAAEGAPKVETKAAPSVKEAQQRWKDAGRDITKLTTEDLQVLLPYVRDTIKNTQLAKQITDTIKSRGAEDAVQVQSPAEVPVRQGAEAGQGVGQEVRRAKEPAGEGQAQGEAKEVAKRYGYPMQIKGAPAYLEPAQRAVVDFMNGDISKGDLRQKFADLKMTQGQMRSVSTRIDWLAEDTEAVQAIIAGEGKTLRLTRGDTVDVKADDLQFEGTITDEAQLRRFPGVESALKHYEKEGLRHVLDAVELWMVAPDTVDFDAAILLVGGKQTLAVRSSVLTDTARVEFSMHHELGHIADDSIRTGGVHSSAPEMNVRVNNAGEVKPMGNVMREVFGFYQSGQSPEFVKTMGYPFDRVKYGKLSANEVRMEAFAQLWAIYNSRDGKEFLADNLPATFDFMEGVHDAAKEDQGAAAPQAYATGAGQRQAAEGYRGAQGGAPAVLRSARQNQGLIDRNINKLPQQLRQPAKNVAMYLNDAMGRGLDYLVFTGDLVGRAVAAGMPAANRFATALANSKAAASERERRIEKIADMYATIEEANKGKGPGTVNEFLFESTRTGKWGYGKYRDDSMGAAFDALGPKAQAFVKAVFAHGDTVLSEKKRIVTDAATSEYDAMIAIARKDGDKAAESKLLAEKVATLDRFKTLFKVREGLPYAPIKRSGAWAVVSKSPEYEEAVAAGDTKRVRELEKNPEHYQVSFVDTKWDASNLQAEIDAAFPGMQTGVIKRAEALDDYSGQSLLPALTNLRSKVDADKGTQHTAMLNLVSQLYLEALAEDSARKSEMRRRGISGDADMLASFATQGRADANFMSSIEYSPEIQDALQQMRTQSKTGGTRKTEIFDELSKRYVGSLDYDVNSWVSKLTNLSSKYFLATSPGYYIQNLTQPFMMSVPAMAGKHDYTAAGQALWKAYSELGPLFKNTKLFDQQFDFTQVPSDVKDAVDELVKRGKIDIGLATEINEYKVDADGKLGNFAQKLNKGMRMAVQKTEAINRLSTAMAAYRLELKRTGSESQALEYADRILTETHGDYTAFNAPRIFNSNFGKVALQFRKFQLVQIAFYAKLIRDAFTNPAERKAALRTLGYSLAHSGVFAGALGLPGYAAVAAIAGFLGGDEDEPYDLTEEMRKALGPEWSQLIMRGAPTLIGADLSGKIGSGQMLSVAPFTNIDLTKQASTKELIGTILGGAAGGMTARMLDGLGQMANGDVYRGLEMTLPKGVGDMLKAGRIAGEGLTRRNGDVLLPKEDVSAVQVLWSAMGIPAPVIAETYQRKQYATDLEQSMQDRSTKLKNQYAKAYRAGDAETMAETREQWKRLQEARKRNEMKAQPLSTLLKAPQEQLKREKKIATQLD